MLGRLRPAIALKLLEERPERSLVVVAKTPVEFEHDEPADLLCGRCERVLARAATAARLAGLVLVCPSCESYNSAAGVEGLL